MLMTVFYIVNMFCVHSVSGDVQQMLCSISRPNNNGREYLLSGSACYINPVRRDRGFIRCTVYLVLVTAVFILALLELSWLQHSPLVAADCPHLEEIQMDVCREPSLPI